MTSLPTRRMLAAVLAAVLGFAGISRGEDSPPTALDTSEYAFVLQSFVDTTGAVDYRGLRKSHARLDRFMRELEALEPTAPGAWDTKEEIAFWLNAYNAAVLNLVLRNYPVQPRTLVSIFYPKNSIRQIAGAFDTPAVSVMGRPISLDDIEHRILRKRFKEPRIHFALVCAAKGCPFLRREPYTGEALDAQLDDQVRSFLHDARKYRADPKSGRVFLSSIFDWFGNDFVEKGVSVPIVPRDSLKTFNGNGDADGGWVRNGCPAGSGDRFLRQGYPTHFRVELRLCGVPRRQQPGGGAGPFRRKSIRLYSGGSRPLKLRRNSPRVPGEPGWERAREED